jgi:hypothetical protein
LPTKPSIPTPPGCKSLSDFIKFIDMDEQLEEELQEFECEFEGEEFFFMFCR